MDKMEKGYFLSVDILGFSEFNKNLTPDELATRVDEWTSLIKKLTKEFSIEKYRLISDTLFVGGKNSSDSLKGSVAKKLSLE